MVVSTLKLATMKNHGLAARCRDAVSLDPLKLEQRTIVGTLNPSEYANGRTEIWLTFSKVLRTVQTNAREPAYCLQYVGEVGCVSGYQWAFVPVPFSVGRTRKVRRSKDDRVHSPYLLLQMGQTSFSKNKLSTQFPSMKSKIQIFEALLGISCKTRSRLQRMNQSILPCIRRLVSLDSSGRPSLRDGYC